MLARPGRGAWEARWIGCAQLANGSDQTVVFGVIADPVPDDAVFLHDCQSAVLRTDASRIDVILASEFLELQAGMRRIALEETIGALGVPLCVGGWIGKQSPEPPDGPGRPQSRSSQGGVSPLSSSAMASRAMRRITSRLPAKRFFQASSSASDARIWDAIASCSSSGRATTFSKAFSNSVDMLQSYQRIPPAAIPYPTLQPAPAALASAAPLGTP